MTRSALFLALLATGLAACSTTGPAPGTSVDGNRVGGFSSEEATRLSTGAVGGPPPGKTAEERAARKQYYQGPRANEWM